MRKIWKDYGRLLLILITFIGLAFYLGMFTSIIPVSLVMPLFAVLLAHIVRKTIHGYINTEELLERVLKQDSIAAALVILGVLFFTVSLTIAFTILLI